MLNTDTLRIGTRGSPMALAQAGQVRHLLTEQRADLSVEIVAISTSADRWYGDLAALGGKGAFLKEVDAALLAGEVDLVVHCVKDIPGDVPAPDGTVTPAYLPRDDVRDCLIHPQGLHIGQLPEGTRIGTSAVRRIAQLALNWPHLQPTFIRGNANRRLALLDAGETCDALLLATCGLERIHEAARISERLDVGTMLPAAGSGALALRCREDDEVTRALAVSLDHQPTHREMDAERTLLRLLSGTCHSPIAALARTGAGGRLQLSARVMNLEGTKMLEACEEAADPVRLGTLVGTSLLQQGARKLLKLTD